MLSSSCTAAGIGSSFSGYIAVCEAVARDRRDTPCVGPIGLGVTGVLFAFGVASTTAVSIGIFHFLASVPQPLSPVLAVLLLVAAALCLPRQSTNLAPSGVAPNPWLLGAVALPCHQHLQRSASDRDVAPDLCGQVQLLVGASVAVVRWGSGHPHLIQM